MNYEQLKNSILGEAICGRLVPQDPDDEPASVLLDRIAEEKNRLVKEKKIKADKNASRIYRTADGHWMERFADKHRPETCIDDEIPFEIPESWEWCRLGFIFDHNTGKALNGGKGPGTPLTYITTSNLYWDRFELDNLKSMNFKESEIDKCTIRKGDLLVCEGGDFGRSAIWNYDFDMRIQNHIHRLRSYVQVETKFYYYILMLYKGIGIIAGKGIGIQGLSSGALHNIMLPLPPLPEQHRIVEKLEEILPKVEEYGKAQDRLDALNSALPEKLKASILQEAIEGRLVPQDPDDEPASVLLDRIAEEKGRLVKEKKIKADKNASRIYRTADGHWMERFADKHRPEACIDDEIPFDIPNGWTWTKIKNVFTMQAGKNIKSEQIKSEYSKETPYLCYGGNGIRGYVPFYNQEGTYPLVGRQGALCGNLNMASGKFYATEHAVVTDGYGLTDVKWAYYFLIALNLNQYATATAQPGLAVGNIIEVPIPLPPLPEQHRIVEKLEEILPRVEALIKA